MTSANDEHLCNGIPIDHRLKRFLQSAEQKHSGGVGKHADIVENFGNSMVRDNGTYPTEHEAAFAAWLAKPDTTGGLVVALQQPAKSQVYTEDVEWVRDECNTLAYLDKSLAFMNGPGGLKTTSVFDAFPYITAQISSRELSNEATLAYKTFFSMVEAKKPDVLFACWRIHGQNDLSFSGKGPGRTNQVESLELPDGHIVRVVNGFHPSYIANYCPNESCFRRLFALELCKALCELNEAWQEEGWMTNLRRRSREKTLQLLREKGRDGEQLNTEQGRERRGADAKKYEAYTESFDSGLESLKQIFEHMISSEYESQSSRDLYEFLVLDQNTSEGICDALLAVSEATKRFAPGCSTPDSALVELGDHTARQLFQFVRDDIPRLVRHRPGLHNDLWANRYSASTSRGLRRNIEKITIRFFEYLTNSFTETSTSWTYNPELIHVCFKELAVSFEDALGTDYDGRQQTTTTNAADSIASLSASLHTLSIESSQSVVSATPVAPATPARSTHSSSDACFICHQQGHWSKECPRRRQGSTTPSKSPPNSSCYNCGKAGHRVKDCPSPKKALITPPRSSSSSYSTKKGNCRDCGQPGHWAGDCPSSSSGGAMTPLSSASSDGYSSRGQRGYGSNGSPSRRQTRAMSSRSVSRDECYRCHKTGHWTRDCPDK